VKDVAQRGEDWTNSARFQRRIELREIHEEWNPESPLRMASDRRQALVENDALTALMLNVSADELCTIYRTQFAVLYGYDHHSYYFDANGRLVPNSVMSTWKTKGVEISPQERTAINQAGITYMYELPFVTLDREADMRRAYSHFEKMLVERS
jgi:hypothetical protein